MWPCMWHTHIMIHYIVFTVCYSLSHAQLFAIPWTAAHQASLFMGFSRQGYWSGLPFPSPGDLPDPGIKPRSPALQARSLPTELPGKLKYIIYKVAGQMLKPSWSFLLWSSLMACPIAIAFLSCQQNTDFVEAAMCQPRGGVTMDLNQSRVSFSSARGGPRDRGQFLFGNERWEEVCLGFLGGFPSSENEAVHEKKALIASTPFLPA